MNKRIRILLILILVPFPLFASPLKDGTAEEKLAHIDFLVKQEKLTDKKTMSALAGILLDADSPPLVQERAAWALGQLNLRSQAKVLVQAAKSKSLLVRSAALDSLMRFRARSGFSIYIDIAKKDPVLSMRQRATLALGLLRWQKTIKYLVELSSDPKEEIRGASTLAMAATHSSKNDFKEIMKEMMEDKNPYVQQRAQVGTDIILRKNKAIQKHVNSSDADIRLFSALFFHFHGTSPDLEPLRVASKTEKNIDVQYEMSLAIKGIEKRMKKAARRKAARKKKKKGSGVR